MDYYFDVFVKYLDEENERPIARMLSSAEMYALLNYLLKERKRFVGGKMRHYPEYIRIE